MDIEKGDLVKGWLNDPNDYIIGLYSEPDEIIGHYIGDYWYYNVIEVPKELAEQLEELGV